MRPPRSRRPLLPLALLALLPAAALALPPVPDTARGRGADDGERARVEARLYVDADAVAPGARVRAGVLLELDRGWHVYWRNSGDSGLPTRLDWDVPGAEIGALAWPAPSVFREAGGMITTYGYAREVLLATEIEVPAPAHGVLELEVAADFLVCKVQCIPGRIDLARSVPVAAETRPSPPAVHALFERWAARVPLDPQQAGVRVEALWSQSAIRPGDSFEAAIAATSCDSAEHCTPVSLAAAADEAFVPDPPATIELETLGARRHPTAPGALLALRGRASPDAVAGDERLRGVLALRVDGEKRHVEVDLPLPRAASGAPVAQLGSPWLDAEPLPANAGLPLLSALGLALLGGLILNLMPCVLPVLAIKVFGIAETSQRGRAALRASGRAYTLGILTTMLALAGLVVGLRAAGTSVGWGFQFQEPLFVVAIASVLTLFALNLFGVFEIELGTGRLAQLSREASGARRSFFEGLLAVVVATPCSAPFMGTAVGFAFASSAAVIVAVFAAIGLGLALPYLLVSHVPAWSRWLPRGGAWMLYLRRVLGFALLATVVWLLSVIAGLVSPDAVVTLLAFLIALSFGAWLLGALQQAQHGVAARVTALGVLAAALLGAASLPLDPEPASAAKLAPASGAWRAYSPEALRDTLASGRPAFVDYTADWCLTCKVNERLVLTDRRVRQAVERLDVVLFKADWTRRDETIRLELARHGKAGVPMYLVYAPSAPERPALLPEILTVDVVVDALNRAAPAQRAQLTEEEPT